MEPESVGMFSLMDDLLQEEKRRVKKIHMLQAELLILKGGKHMKLQRILSQIFCCAGTTSDFFHIEMLKPESEDIEALHKLGEEFQNLGTRAHDLEQRYWKILEQNVQSNISSRMHEKFGVDLEFRGKDTVDASKDSTEAFTLEKKKKNDDETSVKMPHPKGMRGVRVPHRDVSNHVSFAKETTDVPSDAVRSMEDTSEGDVGVVAAKESSILENQKKASETSSRLTDDVLEMKRLRNGSTAKRASSSSSFTSSKSSGPANEKIRRSKKWSLEEKASKRPSISYPATEELPKEVRNVMEAEREWQKRQIRFLRMVIDEKEEMLKILKKQVKVKNNQINQLANVVKCK